MPFKLKVEALPDSFRETTLASLIQSNPNVVAIKSRLNRLVQLENGLSATDDREAESSTETR